MVDGMTNPTAGFLEKCRSCCDVFVIVDAAGVNAPKGYCSAKCGRSTEPRTIDLGNNESMTSGVLPDGDGFLALTFTQSKRFRTRAGADAWYQRKTGKVST